MKVLIVEDNKLAAIAAKVKLLTRLNVDITMVDCGEDAIHEYKQHNFALILMDIGLGEGINGAETTKMIRDIEAENKDAHCPIYALTAHAGSDDIEYQASMGIDQTFKKPIDDDILQTILDNTPELASVIK